jgi:hypothetical protein
MSSNIVKIYILLNIENLRSNCNNMQTECILCGDEVINLKINNTTYIPTNIIQSLKKESDIDIPDCISFSNDILFCDNCGKKYIFHTRKQCIELGLNNKDLRKIKCVYVGNSFYKKYIKSDVNLLLDSLHKTYNENITNKKKQKEKKRKKTLKRELEQNGLNLKSYGDCYSYIKNGKPPLKEVIQNELLKMNNILLKINKFKPKLIEKGINIDNLDNNIYFSSKLQYNYLEDDEYINVAVKKIETEYFLRKYTKFNQYLEIYSPKKAKLLALKDYVSEKSESNKLVDEIIHKERVIEFD